MTEPTLIDRYVHAVGHYLSGKEREDIQLELRSTLHDMLDEQGLDANRREHEDQISKMLKEFGSPEEIALSYHPNHYLIGPRYFPIYVQVVKLVGSITIGVVTLITIIDGFEGRGIGEQFAHLIGGYTSSLFYSLSIVTLIFLALERTGVADADIEAELSKDWDPKKLPAIQERDRVEYFDLIVDLVFTAGFLIILNGIFGVFGAGGSILSGWEFLPDLVTALQTFVPWIMAVMAVEFVLKFLVLLRGVWPRWARWLELALIGADLSILSWILSSAPYSQHVWLDAWIRTAVIVALLINAVLGFVRLYRLVWPERPLPWQRLNPASR